MMMIDDDVLESLHNYDAPPHYHEDGLSLIGRNVSMCYLFPIDIYQDEIIIIINIIIIIIIKKVS